MVQIVCVKELFFCTGQSLAVVQAHSATLFMSVYNGTLANSENKAECQL